MLNTNPDEILFNEDGTVSGIRVGENVATAPIVICDPSYTTEDRLMPTGKVIRAICLLDHPIPNTGDAQSIQIIMPAGALERNSGKYKCSLFKLFSLNFRRLHFYGFLQPLNLREGNLRCVDLHNDRDRQPNGRDITSYRTSGPDPGNLCERVSSLQASGERKRVRSLDHKLIRPIQSLRGGKLEHLGYLRAAHRREA